MLMNLRLYSFQMSGRCNEFTEIVNIYIFIEFFLSSELFHISILGNSQSSLINKLKQSIIFLAFSGFISAESCNEITG